MTELKSFPVFGESGQIGTLSAPARFLDPRSEKTIQLTQGGAIVVPADSLTVQADGSFYLPNSALPSTAQVLTPSASDQASEKLYREGYSIKHVKIDRLIDSPVAQRQEGDTLILPVIEEVLVTEKHMMLREEIRITKSRDEISGPTTNPSPS